MRRQLRLAQDRLSAAAARRTQDAQRLRRRRGRPSRRRRRTSRGSTARDAASVSKFSDGGTFSSDYQAASPARRARRRPGRGDARSLPSTGRVGRLREGTAAPTQNCRCATAFRRPLTRPSIHNPLASVRAGPWPQALGQRAGSASLRVTICPVATMIRSRARSSP